MTFKLASIFRGVEQREWYMSKPKKQRRRPSCRNCPPDCEPIVTVKDGETIELHPLTDSQLAEIANRIWRRLAAEQRAKARTNELCRRGAD
jgi:hypothetical protein